MAIDGILCSWPNDMNGNGLSRFLRVSFWLYRWCSWQSGYLALPSCYYGNVMYSRRFLFFAPTNHAYYWTCLCSAVKWSLTKSCVGHVYSWHVESAVAVSVSALCYRPTPLLNNFPISLCPPRATWTGHLRWSLHSTSYVPFSVVLRSSCDIMCQSCAMDLNTLRYYCLVIIPKCNSCLEKEILVAICCGNN